MRNGANASYVNVDFAADVLYMHVICKMESKVFAVVENDVTLYPNEREMQFPFCVHLFGHIRRHSVFSSFNFNLLSIIQFYIRNACFHRKNSTMNMLGKNRGFDLNVISKQVDTQRMSFD